MKSLAQRLKGLFFPPLQEFSFQTHSNVFLDYIRERVITVLLRLCVLFGSVSVFVGTVALWQEQKWGGIILGNLSFGGVLFLAIRRQIHYKIRGAVLITLAYLFVLFSLSQEVNEFSYVPLFAFVVMTTLLTGRWGGVVAFFVSLGTLLWVNWRLTTGDVIFTQFMPSLSAPFSVILTVYTDWTFYAGIFLFTFWMYFDGFNLAWERENRAMRLLYEERDRLAEAIAREHDLLEQLSQAHQKEIELSRLKSQIITTVSHEFRTPLTVINNSVELLTNYHHKFDVKKREAIQQRIDESVYYLTGLLQDTSLVNKAYTQGFQAHPISMPLNGMAQRLKKDLLQEANDPPNVIVQYDKEDDTAVCLDYDFTYRVVFSFLSNALKYSPPSESIVMSLKLADQLTISVSDAGIGIDPEEAHQIWELFYRGRNTFNQGGLGLGLYLAKRMAQAMDGSVTAVSPGLDQGSTFTLQIPHQPC
jgi:signal transduction histidine kinase